MNRLTRRKADGTIVFAPLRAGQCVDVFDLVNTYGNRLADYEETDLTVEQIKSLQEENTKLKELLKIACESLKEMSDTERNTHGDDIICGHCKYGDCVSLGCEGDYIGECPGFESDECFVWSYQDKADELLKGDVQNERD